MRTIYTVLVVLLAIYLWRSGQAIKNIFLISSNFPIGYYANGDWSSHCTRITDPVTATASNSGHTLKYCEDATFWELYDDTGALQERRVILTCDPGRKAWNTVMGPLRDPHPHGALWMYTPGHPSRSVEKLQRLTLAGYPPGHDFHPLGVEIYPSYAGNASNLFVANHARERTVIEQFVLTPSAPDQATWVRTLVSDYFVSPNSIALTSPTSFYVSNDHLITRRIPTPLNHIFPIAETMLGLPLSWVSHVRLEQDPADLHAAPKIHHDFSALGIAFANGVAVSPDGNQVAVAATSIAEIYYYDRNRETNALKHTHTVPVPFSPDNIMFDHEGSLLVAGHPDFPSLAAVAANKTGMLAPSWVVSISPRIQPEVGSPTLGSPKLYDLRAPVSASERVSAIKSHEVETLFQSNGTGFSTSSTGLRDSLTGALYVVGLYEHGLLVCKP